MSSSWVCNSSSRYHSTCDQRNKARYLAARTTSMPTLSLGTRGYIVSPDHRPPWSMILPFGCDQE